MKVLHFPAQRIALVLVFALLNQTFFPTIAWALTSGPTQPEVSSFTPASTSDMVDLFSGDFQYNIPLLDVGGYPINISYAAGPGMDEEASWVGLGWNLNPGVINRQMRGIPDDFRGDTIYKAFNMRPDVTTGITVGGGLEIKGLPLKLNASLGMYYNTYRGYGIISGISPVLSVANFSKGGLTAGLGLHYDSQNGLDISPYLGMKQKIGRTDFSLSNSITMNSRRGLRDLSISYNTSIKDPNKFQRNLQKAFGAGGSSISFSGSTYTPTSELPLINKSFTFHGTVGFENTTINPNAFLDGYRSEQKLLRNREKQASFGYLHSQLAKPSDVLDFNRERQGLPWREHMPVLPPAFGTNDLFSASGQGSAGQFRAIRSDIGFYRDAFHTNESDSKSFGVELGFAPNLVKVGADVNETTVNAYSKGWTENNPLAKTTGYTDWDGISVYEPVFFKNSGEMTISDTAFFVKIGRTSPVQADLEKTTGAIRTAFQFSSNQKPSGKTTFNISPTIQRTEREKRNDVWQFLTGKEASKHGLEKKIISYKRGSGQIRLSKDATNCAIDSVLSRTKYKGHHISEVIVLKPDGARYVYGVPAYNTYQKEVSFSVSESTVDDGTGLMQYDTIQKDNSIYNRRGRDQYYSAEVVPAYPYAFLLTAVLSPDYIDRTGNGVTSDDYGTAVRINYSKNKKLYNWRTPYGKDSVTVHRVARYQPGRKSDARGKKASYIYGTKEVWYVHSIESATMVAQFYTSSRYDGLGVVNENGRTSIDTSAGSLQKLDKIELYSKSDLQTNGNAATPIKTVSFQYSYELCPGVPNSNKSGGKGKLTLKKIWFTYGKSGRGILNAYSFNYKNGPDATAANRFFYSMNKVDRWGNYKVNPSGYPNTSDYPYSLQDTTVNTASGVNASINDFAGAWCLSRITLPSGGTISVEYESDDYAYVQNKRAGQMYFVKGFSRLNAPTSISDSLYKGEGKSNSEISRYVWIDFAAMNLSPTLFPDTNTLKARCLEEVDNIWFNMHIIMTDTFKENVTGYMKYDKGLPLRTLTSNNFTTVGIPVKIVETDNKKPMHPVTKAALQTMRLELPVLAYPGAEAGSGFEAALKSLVGLAQTIKDLFRGFESNKMNKGDARIVRVTNNNGPKLSWIRLCNPRFKKFGGGHRVKKITLSDNWNNMASGQPASTYGQQYSYTTTQKVKVGNTEQTFIVSSGVASWEPTIGSDENLWRQPVTFNDKIKLAPDNSYYVEKPFCESLFPAPMVGYSEVKVQSIGYAKNNRTGSGWTVNKYYTARDFPTIVDYSAPLRYKDSSSKLQKFFKIRVKDHLSLTQGFVVEVNDMHGKLKQESSYAQNGALISSTTYEYKIDNPNATSFHLNNKVKVVSPNGSIGAEKLLGVDIEMWQDFREETTFTQGTGYAGNTDGFWAWIIPVFLLTVKGILNKEDVRFRSAVTTKYIKRSGILAKVTKMQDGSTIKTENLLWDSETGAVLATKTQNEFEDPIYQFNYPAYWAYDGMGMAYKNAGTHLTAIYFQGGKPYLGSGGTNPLPNFDQMFTDGDELGARRYPSKWGFPNDTFRLTVYKVPGDQLRFYTDKGVAFSSGTKRYDLYMLRSGRRNMAGTPVGSVVSKTNPLNYSTIQTFALDASNNKIVDASANTFRDLWQRDCDCQPGSSGDTINPYRHGMKGSWRLDKAYVNHRERTASKLLTSVGMTNIRTDGTNKGFVPFWDYVSGIWTPNPTNDVGWVRQSTASIYDFKGNQNEELDALGIYSSAQYGYQANLNTAVAHNTRFRQGMFEGFEDYNFDIVPGCDVLSDCSFSDHNSFGVKLSEGSGTAISSDSVAHTGKYSYRVSNNMTFGMTMTLDTNASTAILEVASNVPYNYKSGPNACHPSFKPSPGTYLVSGWVYTGGNCYSVQNGPYISIYQQSGTTLFQNIYPSGPVIEGWQRMYGQVTISTATGNFQIRLVNTLNFPVYFDDIRFHPWLGNMKSFVYDPISLRLMATLDENNYATFYEYDDEGMLIRLKRETERGVMTIEEHRSSLKF